jgi:hypothetical protein
MALLIERLEPLGEIGGGEPVFKRIEQGAPDHDREFLVVAANSPRNTMFGVISERDKDSQVDIKICHSATTDSSRDHKRVADDSFQIISHLLEPAKFPTGVMNVILVSSGTARVPGPNQSEILVTSIRLRIVFRSEVY